MVTNPKYNDKNMTFYHVHVKKLIVWKNIVHVMQWINNVINFVYVNNVKINLMMMIQVLNNWISY